MASIRIKESVADRTFLFGIYVFLVTVLIAVLYPLIYILSSSFSSPSAVVGGKVWLLPVDFTVAGYKAVFNSSLVMKGYMNSAIYAVFGTMINVALTVMIAYPLSKRSLYGRSIVMIILLITMFFDGGLIPTYLLVKNLGLIDTRWALWLPGAMAVFQVIVARTFFQSSIPEELYEAGQLDGCRDIRFLWSMVLPLSKPILAVMTLMYAVGHWNAYFDALIYLKSENLFPLQLVLRNILLLNATDTEMLAHSSNLNKHQGFQLMLKYALIVVASLPVLVLYPFVQKHFVKGVMIGSLKG
ncbi:carbohydrate ABC transporter permease [Paenibacillus tarimensis]